MRIVDCRSARRAQDGSVVQSQVQDGVHHAGHRERRAGTNRDQKRIGIVPEALAHAPLKVGGRRIDLIESAGGDTSPANAYSTQVWHVMV